MASILYFGDNNPASTSAHRAHALTRLGHSVSIYNPFSAATGLLGSRWLAPLHYRTGYRLLQSQVRGFLDQIINSVQKPDLVWVDSGELFGFSSVTDLKAIGCPVVLYNVDDPTGGRDGQRFNSLLKAIPVYDMVVVVRKETEAECKALGAKRTMCVMRSYDEVSHQPFTDISQIPLEFRSEVAFIGTWMEHEKRDEFFIELINNSIPISIWGGRWEKSPYWKVLRPYFRGGALSGRAYVAAIQGAKLCLGMLSKGNRDLHTTRSLEIPYAGGLLCAERTNEHLTLYQDGVEAVFWSDAKECADICKKLLANNSLREKICYSGMQKVRKLGLGNENMSQKVLSAFNIN